MKANAVGLETTGACLQLLALRELRDTEGSLLLSGQSDADGLPFRIQLDQSMDPLTHLETLGLPCLWASGGLLVALVKAQGDTQAPPFQRDSPTLPQDRIRFVYS